MSGIAGLVRDQPSAPVRGPLERMAEQMARRGPDGRELWCDGPVGLAHLALWSTPESQSERQPLALQPGGPVIAADARVDNREELLEALALRHRREAPIGDAALILHAYARWGEPCLERLAGDYAFAIWDPARAVLFCARDPFGVRPLFYSHSPTLFAFASEVGALSSLEEVPRELDELSIAFFLENVAHDQERTVYRAVRRLPPAHALALRDGRIDLRRHFSLDPALELPRAPDEEHVEHFRELFTQAVRVRMRTVRARGTLLSGGLDSSSITCTARELAAGAGEEPLHSFSVVFDDVPRSDESPFIQAVLDGGGLTPHVLHGDRMGPYADGEGELWHQDQPCYGANLYMHRAMYRAAREAGVGVMLDGVAGDIVVDYGLERLLQLFLRGRFLALRRELRQFARRAQGRPRKVFQRCVRRPIASALRMRAPRPLAAAWDGWKRRRGHDPDELPGLTHPELARRLDLRQRVRELRAQRDPRPPTARGTEHYQALVDGLMHNALGTLEALAAAHGIEPRFPFLDRRLVEFCLALPAALKLRDGYNRWILRRAAPGMPDAVRWRDWKGDLGHSLAHGLLVHERALMERVVMEDAFGIGPWIDLAALRRRYERFQATRGPDETFDLCKALDLALWLRAAGFSQSGPTGSGQLR